MRPRFEKLRLRAIQIFQKVTCRFWQPKTQILLSALHLRHFLRFCLPKSPTKSVDGQVKIRSEPAVGQTKVRPEPSGGAGKTRTEVQTQQSMLI